MNTTLQTIKNISGNTEYVLLPIAIYENLKENIDRVVSQCISKKDYVDFEPSDFIKNKIALARMKAKITQVSLAKHLNVSQAYISKIENDEYKVTKKLFEKVTNVIEKLANF
ncbi:MAG: helix-turn-helix transcriptional regulator [bacterium]